MLNLTSKTNSWTHKLPFDGRVCLEGNKREAFLVSLEYKAFLGTILVLASPIAKLTSFLHCNWSAKKDPNQHCPTKQGPATTNSTALAQWLVFETPLSLDFNQATLNAYRPDDIFFVVLEAKQFAFLLIIHMEN